MKIRPCSDQDGTVWFDEDDKIVSLPTLESHKNFRALLGDRLLIVTFVDVSDSTDANEILIASAMDNTTLEWVPIDGQLLEVEFNG